MTALETPAWRPSYPAVLFGTPPTCDERRWWTPDRPPDLYVARPSWRRWIVPLQSWNAVSTMLPGQCLQVCLELDGCELRTNVSHDLVDETESVEQELDNRTGSDGRACRYFRSFAVVIDSHHHETTTRRCSDKLTGDVQGPASAKVQLETVQVEEDPVSALSTYQTPRMEYNHEQNVPNQNPDLAIRSQHGTWTSCGQCPDVLREQFPEVVDIAKSGWWNGCHEKDSGLLQPPTTLLVLWSKSATRMQLPVWMTAYHVEHAAALVEDLDPLTWRQPPCPMSPLMSPGCRRSSGSRCHRRLRHRCWVLQTEGRTDWRTIHMPVTGNLLRRSAYQDGKRPRKCTGTAGSGHILTARPIPFHGTFNSQSQSADSQFASLKLYITGRSVLCSLYSVN